MNALIKFPGGKNKIKDWVISHFPDNYESMTYVELAVGGGSIILNKKPSVQEIINDINESLINIYFVLKCGSEQFINQLKTVTYNEQTFLNALIDQDQPFEDLIDQAVNEYILYRFSRGGMKKTFAWSDRLRGGIPGDQNAWQNSIDNLWKIANRLNFVDIQNKDFKFILNQYNKDNTFIYCDPPYIKSTRISKEVYDREFTDNDHKDLLDIVTNHKAKILISGYNSKLYNDKLKNWNKYEKLIINHSGQTKIKSTRLEVLWVNY